MTRAPHLDPDIQVRAGRVRLLFIDADGVLTDGRIVYTERGDELKFFNVRDGLGLKLWHGAGLRSAVVTGRRSRLLARRCKELGVGVLEQGRMEDKLEVYRTLLKRFKLADEQVCAIGDDLVDLPVLRRAGFAVAVRDAVEEARRCAHYVTQIAGGRGAVREVIDLTLKAQGLWDGVVAKYR